MSEERTRERVIDLIKKMRQNTFDKGCTPAEAAKFAAKVAEWMERYQIEEAELKNTSGEDAEVEVCQNFLRTGRRVFNPGMTQVVNGLCIGMCCKCVLLHQGGEAVYGIVGDQCDSDYVCQVALMVVPALEMMANLEGAEHGREKAGLVRWRNQYLTGAGDEIRHRLETERRARSKIKERQQLELRWKEADTGERLEDLPESVIEQLLNALRDGTFDIVVGHGDINAAPNRALMVVTGETLAVAKRKAVDAGFKQLYPKTRKTQSRSEYDHTAHEQGRKAGKRVGLHIGIEE